MLTVTMSSDFFEEIDRRKRLAVGEQKQDPHHSSTTSFDVDIKELWVKPCVNEPVFFVEREEPGVDRPFKNRSFVAWAIDGEEDLCGRYWFFRPHSGFVLTVSSDFVLLSDAT